MKNVNPPEINEQIGLLLATLAKTQAVDAQTRALLVALQRETSRLTDLTVGTAHEDNASVAQRLETLAVQFEADHPAIGTAIRQTIDALVQAGI